jgi:hypothetical protein
MPRKPTDDLFLLIRSFSKSEKRYFKLFTSRSGGENEKKFIALFDYLDKQSEYNEAALLAKLKTIKPSQLSNLKAHLYKQLLLSLKLCNSYENTDVMIRAQLDYAVLLYDKCLFSQCVKIVDKAKKMAVKYDRSLLLLNILELEKLVITKTIALHNEKRVQTNVNETEAVSHSIENINTFSNLSLKLNSLYTKIGFIRNKADLKKVQQLFKSSLPAFVNEEQLSVQERLYLYYSYVGYYFFIQDIENGYLFARQWVALFDAHPDMIIPKLEMYIKGINNLMVAQFKMLRFAEFNETNKKLTQIRSSSGLSDNIQLILFKYAYVHEINRYFMLGDFTAGVAMVPSIVDDLDKFLPKLDKHYVLIFYYKIACLYFGNENFKEAIQWLNKITNSRDIDLREDIHSFSRILSLICHFELGHRDLVDYYITSTYRFLSKKGNLHQFQKIILSFLKRLRDEIKPNDLIKGFAGLKEQLLPLAANPYEKRAFIYFDIISWLESKIEQKPVQEIIKGKALLKMTMHY